MIKISVYAVVTTLVITLLSAAVPSPQAPNNKCCKPAVVGAGPPPQSDCYSGDCFTEVPGFDHCSGNGTTPITPGSCGTLKDSHCDETVATLPVGAYECDIAVCEDEPEKRTCKWKLIGPTVADAPSCSGSHPCP